jgi:hypothetical protein
MKPHESEEIKTRRLYLPLDGISDTVFRANRTQIYACHGGELAGFSAVIAPLPPSFPTL